MEVEDLDLEQLEEFISNLQRDKEILERKSTDLKENKNKALTYIQNYNHMGLKYQNSETKETLNVIKNILNGR